MLQIKISRQFGLTAKTTWPHKTILFNNVISSKLIIPVSWTPHFCNILSLIVMEVEIRHYSQCNHVSFGQNCKEMCVGLLRDARFAKNIRMLNNTLVYTLPYLYQTLSRRSSMSILYQVCPAPNMGLILSWQQ